MLFFFVVLSSCFASPRELEIYEASCRESAEQLGLQFISSSFCYLRSLLQLNRGAIRTSLHFLVFCLHFSFRRLQLWIFYFISSSVVVLRELGLRLRPQGSCLSSNDDDFETPGSLSSPSAGCLCFLLCFCHHPDIVIQIRRFFC